MNLVGTVLQQSAGISDAQSQFCPAARRQCLLQGCMKGKVGIKHHCFCIENWGQYTVVRWADTSFSYSGGSFPTGSLYFPFFFFMILQIFSRENVTHII